jgi:hypothetical protein
MSFNQAVGHHLQKHGENCFSLFGRLDKEDNDREMKARYISLIRFMQAAMGAESSVWVDHGCSVDAMFLKGCENFIAQEIASGNRVFIEIDCDFRGRSCWQHSLLREAASGYLLELSSSVVSRRAVVFFQICGLL